MKLVADTDILSIFAKIHRLDILKKISESVVISSAVKAELARGKIDVKRLAPDFTILTKDELKALKQTDNSLDRGERECFVIARNRHLPLASNETLVHKLCKREGIDYLTLPRILRFAITEGVITRQETRKLVSAVETEEHTVVKNKTRSSNKNIFFGNYVVGISRVQPCYNGLVILSRFRTSWICVYASAYDILRLHSRSFIHAILRHLILSYCIILCCPFYKLKILCLQVFYFPAILVVVD